MAINKNIIINLIYYSKKMQLKFKFLKTYFPYLKRAEYEKLNSKKILKIEKNDGASSKTIVAF